MSSGRSPDAVRVPTIFLGSGGFALPVAATLAAHPSVELRAILTAPPRLAGRGRREQRSAVDRWAAEQGLPRLTPERLRAPEAIAAVRGLAPDLLVLADYGQIVPRDLLDLPRYGALNLHPSLLPRHRGASPIPAAILAGDERTGVTLMCMDAGLDTGPIIAQRAVPLGPRETAPELEARLAAEAADLLRKSLVPWLAGEVAAHAQPTEGVTLTRPLSREDGRIDPRRSASELERQVRAYQPWPGSFFEAPDGRVVVWRSVAEEASPDDEPGRIVAPSGLTTAQGVLRLLEVQPSGGRRMSGAELLRGRPGFVGSTVLDPAVAVRGTCR